MHVQLYAVPITSMYGIEGRASAPHVVSPAASPTSSASLLVETVEEVALAPTQWEVKVQKLEHYSYTKIMMEVGNGASSASPSVDASRLAPSNSSPSKDKESLSHVEVIEKSKEGISRLLSDPFLSDLSKADTRFRVNNLDQKGVEGQRSLKVFMYTNNTFTQYKINTASVTHIHTHTVVHLH